MDKTRIDELGKLHFLAEKENIIIIGPPGVGKSMIATGIGRNACAVGKKVLFVNTADQTFIKTSLDYNEIMDLIPVMIDYNIERNSGFPYTLSTSNIHGADLVVAQGLSYNVSELHRFLFDDMTYQPSASVTEISDYITEYTGVPEVQLDEQLIL